MKLYGFLILALSTSFIASAGKNIMKVGSGSVSKNYYPIAGGICKVAKAVEAGGNKTICFPLSTKGSTDNADKINKKAINYALIRAGVANSMYKGSGDYSKNENLRIVAFLYDEDFTVVTAGNSAIKSFSDLEAKKIYFAGKESGAYKALNRLLISRNLTLDYFSSVVDIKDSEVVTAICNGSVDAALFVIGNPFNKVLDAISSCQARVIPVTNIAEMLESTDQYIKTTIVGGIYGDAAIRTFGEATLLVTTADESDEFVYQLTKSMLNNIDKIRKSKKVINTLNKINMATKGIIIPLHPGAEKAYKEESLLN